MTTTERLKQHIEDIDERRVKLFFDVQNATSSINNRIYNYYIIIAIFSLAVLLVDQFAQNKDKFLIFWSELFVITSLCASLIQYLMMLNKSSSKMYGDICTMYKNYDDEYYILKKFNAGKIKENLIKQFYLNKSNKLNRYKCHSVKLNWFIWTNISLLFASIILLLLA
jgi:hypothetical protein